MGLKNVKISLPQISKELEKTNSSREFLIKNNREVIINCSQAIIAIHKNDLGSAKLKIKKAKLLLAKLKQKSTGDLSRYILTPEQELVEAIALLSIIEGKQIPSYKSIKVSGESYILGLLDCIGELKRQVIDQIRIEGLEEAVGFIKNAKNIYITGSGTSYNSALIAKQILSKYVKIKSEPIIASELQFAPETIEEDSVLIAISQSGESADVLEAVRIAKKSNCKIISIVNLLTSSLTRKGDVVLGMNCGPEIGVAATKSFTAQLIVLYKIVQKLNENITINFEEFSKSISEILENPVKIQEIAKELKDVSDIYILGRGINYPIAIESALKLKELTYIHAEGIPGGELKHGPLALMDTDVFVIVINPNDSTYTDTLTSAREIKARGAKIIGVSDIESDVYDYWIKIPKINEILYPISEIIPIQLLTYYSALEKDTDPDYPRNLAKSVTVK